MATRYSVFNPEGEEFETPSEARSAQLRQALMLDQMRGGGNVQRSGSNPSEVDGFYHEQQQGPTFVDRLEAKKTLMREGLAGDLALNAQHGAQQMDVANLNDRGQTTRAEINIRPEIGNIDFAKQKYGDISDAVRAEAGTRAKMATLRNGAIDGTAGTLSPQQMAILGVDRTAWEDPEVADRRGTRSKMREMALEGAQSPNPQVRAWAQAVLQGEGIAGAEGEPGSIPFAAGGQSPADIEKTIDPMLRSFNEKDSSFTGFDPSVEEQDDLVGLFRQLAKAYVEREGLSPEDARLKALSVLMKLGHAGPQGDDFDTDWASGHTRDLIKRVRGL